MFWYMLDSKKGGVLWVTKIPGTQSANSAVKKSNALHNMNLMENIFYAQIVYSLQIWINAQNRLHMNCTSNH